MLQVEQKIPSEYSKLYSDYVKKVRASNTKIQTMMWVVLERGDEIKMMPKKEHIERVQEMLCSGDEKQVRMVEEVMMRTLGVWRVR